MTSTFCRSYLFLFKKKNVENTSTKSEKASEFSYIFEAGSINVFLYPHILIKTYFSGIGKGKLPQDTN